MRLRRPLVRFGVEASGAWAAPRPGQLQRSVTAICRRHRLRREADGIHNPVAAEIIVARQSLRQDRLEAQEESVETRRKKAQQKQGGGIEFANGLQLQNAPSYPPTPPFDFKNPERVTRMPRRTIRSVSRTYIHGS
jgi:hypothetical protein